MPLMRYLIQNMNQCKKLMNELIGKIIESISKLLSLSFRTTLLGDIRRILYPPSIYNRTVYDFDEIVNRSPITTLDNNDEERYNHSKLK
jgi:hypothetical protein